MPHLLALFFLLLPVSRLSARPPLRLPPQPAALIQVAGRGATEDRLLLLPIRPAGGLRFRRALLEMVAPDLAADLLTTFFHREGLPGAGAPPDVEAAALLFGAGGGAFRLTGDLAPKPQEDFWRDHGLRWGPAGGIGRALEGEELWGWTEAGLLYGAWGHRTQHAWLGGLDGRGRRIYSLGDGPRREALSVWVPGLRAREERVQSLSRLPEGPWPAVMRRVEVALDAPGRGRRTWTWKVRLVPTDPRELPACADWLRMFWNHTDEARVRTSGPVVELRYQVDREDSRRALLAWAESFTRWLRGDAYRSLL